jgi:TPR repeat protein
MAFPESQLELGHLFANFGDPLNQCRLEWYFRARENGVSSASFYIASTLFGLGLYFEAKKYDQEAADLGDAESQFYLGFYYYSLWDIPYFLSTFTTDKKISSGMVS